VVETADTFRIIYVEDRQPPANGLRRHTYVDTSGPRLERVFLRSGQ
jgi:hypothetical protein